MMNEDIDVDAPPCVRIREGELQERKCDDDQPCFSLSEEIDKEQSSEVLVQNNRELTAVVGGTAETNGNNQPQREEIINRNDGCNAGEASKVPGGILVQRDKTSVTATKKKLTTALVIRKKRSQTPDRIRSRAAKLYDEIHHLIDQYNSRKQREKNLQSGFRPVDAVALEAAARSSQRHLSADYRCSSSRNYSDGPSVELSEKKRNDFTVVPKNSTEDCLTTSTADQTQHIPSLVHSATSPRSPRSSDGGVVGLERKIKSPIRLPNLKEEFRLSRQKYLEAAEEERVRSLPLEQRTIRGDIQKDPSSFSLRFQLSSPVNNPSLIQEEQNKVVVPTIGG